jgi:hypothetical protein
MSPERFAVVAPTACTRPRISNGASAYNLETEMQILIYYTVMVIVGTAIAALIGIWLDPISQILSLTVFFTLFFGILWLAWVAAVRLTEPKDTAVASANAARNQPAE